MMTANPMSVELKLLAETTPTEFAIQAVALIGCVAFGVAIQIWGQKAIAAKAPPGLKAARVLGLPITAIALWVAFSLFNNLALNAEALRLSALVFSGWALARIAIGVIGSTPLGWVIACLAIAAVGLEGVRMLSPVVSALDAPHMFVGDVRISPWFVIKGLSIIAGLFWLAQRLGALIDHGLSNEQVLSRSGRVLFAKLAHAGLYVLAVLLSLSVLGVDFTALAVLSGAIGLGLGFGLQKIISNYVAGLILLFDRSIKPGDVIEVDFGDGKMRGEVTELAGRYTAITLRTGTETLIPNELLVSSPVTNWSHTSRDVQVRIPVGVSYSTNVERAIQICIEAAHASPRVLAQPKAVCLLVGFGDSSVDLDVRFWISDAENGVRNAASGVYLEIWRRFRAEGIEIPFPQRDLHIKSSTPLSFTAS